MRPFMIFLIGALIAVAGVGYAMVRLGVPGVWIGVAVAIIAGIAIASGAGLARKETQAEETGGPVNVNAGGGEQQRSS
ncbi:MAG: hypothetical protein ACOC20_07245 [Oceanicaulis sp.]